MTKKKGRSKGGGHGGDNEDDDASTEDDPIVGMVNQLEQEGDLANDKAQANSPRCPHVGKAVNVSAIKKALKAAWIPIGRCGICTREKRTPTQTGTAAGKKGINKGVNKANVPVTKGKTANANAGTTSLSVDPNVPSTVWLCLRCGVQSCRPKDQSKHGGGHALQHYKVPRSDLHCICINVTPPSANDSDEDSSRWNIYCFECDSNLYVDSYKKLREAVEFVKRLSETKSVAAPGASKVKGVAAVAKKTESAIDNSSPGSSSDGAIAKTRGLVNLGNTCFFNSVMQGLTQSHPFTMLFLARKHCQKGTVFELPAVELENHSQTKDTHLAEQSPTEKLQKKNTFDAVTLSLEEAGNMTLAYASFLSDMANMTAKGAVNPSQLFSQISTRSPQFRGFQQQDAHELLRHLIEGLRMEEVKRQRRAILKFFGLTEKTDPKTVEGHIKKKLQALKQHSNYTIIDKIFGGHLVSTVVCEVCHNSSQNYEPFLDLSLPLIEERDHPPTSKQKQSSKQQRKKLPSEESQANNEIDGNINSISIEERKSKHQLKKEKRKTQKEKRKNKKTNAKESQISNKFENDTPTKEKETAVRSPENTKDDNEKDGKGDTATNQADVKVIVESASEKGSKEDDKESKVSQDSTTQRLQLRTTARTPLSSEKAENRSRSISPNISERMRALSKDRSPTLGPNNKSDNNGTGSSSSKHNLPTTLKSDVAKNLQKFQLAESSKANKNEGKISRGGSEEDDEGDAYLDDDEDWEWEYEEPEKDVKEKEDSDEAIAGSEPEYLPDVTEDTVKEKPKLVSLNPLPPERLLPSDQDKSSVDHDDPEPDNEDSETTTGESSNADIEDNIDMDVGVTSVNASTTSNTASLMHRLYSVESSTAEWAASTTNLLEKPFQPNPDHLDPHMEELCRNIRKLSVTTSSIQDISILAENIGKEGKQEALDADNSATNSSAYQTATPGTVNNNYQTPQKINGNNNKIEDKTLEQELHQMYLQNEWVTRSLTSIAPRYRTKPGECSVYSCLTQFTAPELLTGNNKWACGRCTKLKKEERLARQEAGNNRQQNNDYTSDTSTDNQSLKNTDAKKTENDKPTEKNETVYSNASKQLLVFCPPAVLTIHLKRFQQTMSGLRKVSKHVQFPLYLDLAPFCSSTSMSMGNIPSGVEEIKYYLFGVVEHSGRLQGGHYTAFVNTRASQTSKYLSSSNQKEQIDFYKKFYSSPNAKTDHIEVLLKIIEMKSKLANEKLKAEDKPSLDKVESLGDMKTAAAAAAFGDGNSSYKDDIITNDIPTISDKFEYTPSGKWYHISDSNVIEVAQEKVLKCQAYILLYERIK